MLNPGQSSGGFHLLEITHCFNNSQQSCWFNSHVYVCTQVLSLETVVIIKTEPFFIVEFSWKEDHAPEHCRMIFHVSMAKIPKTFSITYCQGHMIIYTQTISQPHGAIFKRLATSISFNQYILKCKTARTAHVEPFMFHHYSNALSQWSYPSILSAYSPTSTAHSFNERRFVLNSLFSSKIYISLTCPVHISKNCHAKLWRDT